MDRHALKLQKKQPKRLPAKPVFKAMKKGKFPRPFSKMGGPRLSATDLIDVSPNHQVIFLWKDGQILTDRSFYGWLLKKVGTANLYPLLEMHWHPSHKGLHIKTPCEASNDYTDRQLPGAKELDIRTVKMYDPQVESDRAFLIGKFCEIAGIDLGPEGALL